MRKRNYLNAKGERWIMVIAAVILLGVFTVTGLLMRESPEDKVIIDFTVLEEANRELAQQMESYEMEEETTLETNSGTVTIPALDIESVDADKIEEEKAEEEVEKIVEPSQIASKPLEEEVEEELDVESVETSTFSGVVFNSNDMLQWPVVGNVLLNYSMDKTIYFPTLKQYKYNPGIVIQAVEGEVITSASAGIVEDVYYDVVTGNTVIVKINDTYSIIYGQLSNILVEKGSYLNKGMILGEIAIPTKYFSVEGCNLYLELRENGIAINPLSKLE